MVLVVIIDKQDISFLQSTDGENRDIIKHIHEGIMKEKDIHLMFFDDSEGADFTISQSDIDYMVAYLEKKTQFWKARMVKSMWKYCLDKKVHLVGDNDED